MSQNSQSRNPVIWVSLGGLLLIAVLWFGWAKWGIVKVADTVRAAVQREPGNPDAGNAIAALETVRAALPANSPKSRDAIRALEQVRTIVEKNEAQSSSSEAIATLGQVGDLFGAFNAFVAGLALIGVGIAAWQQHKMLKHTQEELAMAKNQDARQSLEPLLFKLLDRHDELRSRTKITTDDFQKPSVNVAELGQRLRSSANASFAKDLEDVREVVVDEYKAVYADNETKLGPYFRSLYHIFNLINISSVSPFDKASYANIVRATLGSDELYLLALNCLVKEGKGFKPLVEDYGVLKHMTSDSIEKDPAHLCLEGAYKETAWLAYRQRENRRVRRASSTAHA